MNLYTISEIALDRAKKTLRIIGYQFSQAIPINKGRYQILRGVGYTNILLVFKKAPFLKYGDKFKFEGREGLGETINSEHLRIAFNRGCKIIARVDNEGNVLLASFNKFRDTSIKWITKEAVEVRSNTIHLFKKYDSFDNAVVNLLLEENTLLKYGVK